MNSFLNHESFPSVASLRRQPSVITTHDGRNTQIKRKYEEWTKDLDQRLEAAISELGCPSNARKHSRAPSDSTLTWNAIAERVGRSGKQCRERWMNHLCVKNRRIGPWTHEEWCRLQFLADKYGKQWSKFVHLFPGRSSLDLRNKWFSRQRSLKRCAQLDWTTPLLSLDYDPSKTDLEPLPLDGNSEQHDSTVVPHVPIAWSHDTLATTHLEDVL